MAQVKSTIASLAQSASAQSASVQSASVLPASTVSVTVNAAFLQEIKEVNCELYQLMDRIRGYCAGQLRTLGDGRSLVEMLAELRDHLALHFALEEAYGYFEDPVHVAPRLSEQAKSLRAEHQSLYVHVSDLVDEVDDLHYRGRLAAEWERVRQWFHQLDDQLQSHESRENELILAAYDDDIGVGD